jgi:hypothetical protein
VDVVVWVLAFGGWPAIMVTAMFLNWCVYEIEELEPRLVWAVPKSAVPTIQKLVGEAVQPSSPWVPRQGAIHYPWKPVPAYIDRSFTATVAWAGRQQIGAWL